MNDEGKLKSNSTFSRALQHTLLKESTPCGLTAGVLRRKRAANWEDGYVSRPISAAHSARPRGLCACLGAVGGGLRAGWGRWRPALGKRTRRGMAVVSGAAQMPYVASIMSRRVGILACPPIAIRNLRSIGRPCHRPAVGPAQRSTLISIVSFLAGRACGNVASAPIWSLITPGSRAWRLARVDSGLDQALA